MQRADKNDVNIWGINIRYVQAGEGPVVLLLHGLGTSLITWYCNIDALADAGFTVIAPDLPGYGDSDKPGHLNYDPDSASEFLYDFTQELGLERFSLVGSSAGSLIAGLFALEHPECVDKLVLVGPGGLGRQVSWFLRLMSIPVVGELVYRPNLHDRIGISKRIFHRPPEFLDDILPEMYRVRALPGARSAMLRSVRSSINYWGLRSQQNILDRLRGLPMPLMTVWGEEDSIIPISQADAVRAALPDSIVYTVPECGHWPQMEKHELFNGLLTSFLTGTMGENESRPGP
jgi:pimeloyl-ACP methyl ester carboxylesterase